MPTTLENAITSHRAALDAKRAEIKAKKESHHAGTPGGDKVIASLEKDEQELVAEIKRLEGLKEKASAGKK